MACTNILDNNDPTVTYPRSDVRKYSGGRPGESRKAAADPIIEHASRRGRRCRLFLLIELPVTRPLLAPPPMLAVHPSVYRAAFGGGRGRPRPRGLLEAD